ncbi:nucleoside triphosphate pyrophosphohydrolase [compost metagenome]
MDPEQVLRKANTRFEARFNKMIEFVGLDKKDFDKLSLEEKEIFWQKAKKALKSLALE